MGRRRLKKTLEERESDHLKEIEECIAYHHDIVSAVVVAPLTLRVSFDDGKETIYHVIETAKRYLPAILMEGTEALYDSDFFYNFEVRKSDIWWSDDLALGCETLYHHGEEVVPPRKS